MKNKPTTAEIILYAILALTVAVVLLDRPHKVLEPNPIIEEIPHAP